MTSPPLNLAEDRSEAVDAPDCDPVGRVGREVIRQVDMDRIAALIERRASSALLDELAGIVLALEAADPRGAGRRSGIVGRLLGRDLGAQARARQAHEHVRIRLDLAERRAQDVATHMCELDEAVVHVHRQRTRLCELAERGRGAIDAFDLGVAARPDAMARRLDHLAVLISTWDVAAAHMRLVRQYGELLLTRYAYVRDVAVPQWRLHADTRGERSFDADDATPDPLRVALATLLQATAPEPAVFPRAQDVRV